MLTITPDQRRAAKAHLLSDLQGGYAVPEAHRRTTIPLHRTTLYRFRRRVQADPVAACCRSWPRAGPRPSDEFTITLPLVKRYLTFPSECAIVGVAPNNITPLGTHPVTVQTPRFSALPITSAVPPGASCNAWVDEDAASI